MKNKKSLVLFICFTAAIILFQLIANGIQTSWGKVEVSKVKYEITDRNGKEQFLTGKLYRPKSATAANPAPAVLMLHGYQNDKETNDAYSIELSRRGIVVFSLDEYGHVWTCGGVQKQNGLGRLANGGYAGTSNNGSSNAFGLVYVAANQPLSNITMIAAGDVSYYCLDADGYIWSWGDSWNSSCGQGPNKNSFSPQRVVKGNTLDDDNDGTYLLAKSVGGGQSSGMAVSISGRPVTWGANPGQGSSSTADVPGYVKNQGSTIHDDVILINKGDNWGFYGRADGSMYAWGLNDNGQLGIGSTTYQSSAVKINPPTQCDAFKDPKPEATITPKSMKVCASAFDGVTLDCGMVFATNMQPNYKITWYKDGTQVSTGTGANYEYKTPNGASGIGKYSVKIEYVGTRSGCEVYLPSEDEIEISAYTQEFTPEGYYCGDEATVKVTPSGNTAVYSWWQTKAAASLLAQSVGSESIKVDVSDIAANSDGSKTIYVSETSPTSGGFLTSSTTKSGGDNFSSGLSGLSVSSGAASFCTGFEVKQPLTITSVSYFANTLFQGWQGTSYANDSITGVANVEIAIVGSDQNNNGAFIASSSKVFGKFTGTFERTIHVNSSGNATDASAQVKEATCTGSVTLEPGVYFLALAKVTTNGKFQEFKLAREGGSNIATTMKDNIDGTYLQATGLVSYNNPSQGPGLFHNIKFGGAQGFCDVIAVSLKQDCPCDEPEDVVINCEDYSFYDDETATAVICENSTTPLTLTTDSWSSSTTKFEYIWYKDGTVTKAATTGATGSTGATGAASTSSSTSPIATNSPGIPVYCSATNMG